MKDKCKGKTRQFEVTFESRNNKFEDEYGFGNNSPAVLHAKNKKCLVMQLSKKIKRDKIKIKSIKLG